MMNSRVPTLAVLAAVLSAAPVFAQAALEMPAPSPKAKVEQRVGVTDFAVDYSSPGVKGRQIWGTLVPYDELWRTGANASTKLTASRDFKFGDKSVSAGTYALFTIPGRSSWKVILNSNAKAGTGDYDEKLDVARITLTPESAATSTERMAFRFADTTDDATKLVLDWEKLRLNIPISVDTKGHVNASIDQSLGDSWRPHYQSARYLLDNNGDLDTALGYIGTSIAIKPTWSNNWVKAQILAKKGRKAEAIAAAEMSQKLGKGEEAYSFSEAQIAKSIAEWKK